jgi:hypothetical protein
MAALSKRLRYVRITCGDWRRVLTPAAVRATLGASNIGILLDPPYLTSGDLYAHGSDDVAHAVRDWCKTAPSDLRIVLCGYESEHTELESLGWRKSMGVASHGYGTDNGKLERLWLSPACIDGQLRLEL